MKHDFEEYFPLPWNIETDEDESFWMITPARGGSFLDFGTIKVPKYADVRDVMNYIILCANLMPEAVEVIRDMIGIAAVLDYGTNNAVIRAKKLLAKLEGGAEE